MSDLFEAQHPSEPTTLRVHLLGPPEVEWAGRPLPVPRRQARGLLYRLATRLQPVPREHLCFLFWPDTPETAARRHLTHLLTHLRRALPAPDLLLATEEHVALDASRVWSDVMAFEALCANLTLLPPTLSPLSFEERGEGAKGVRGEVLHRAVGLYRGPFLAGFSLPECAEFETWAGLERRTWESLYLKVLMALIETLTAQGEYDAAIACAQRYLETDDLAEDVHRRLIELYAATGDRSAALRQFEQCVAALERELGVGPLPETRAVYRVVLEGGVGQPEHPLERPTWVTLPGLEVPLVGREAATASLQRAYVAARAGHGGVILISGEAGIGKSRLVQEFATGLAARAQVLAGASHPGGQAVPYQPIVQALRGLLGTGDLETRRGGGDRPRSSPLPVTLSPTWLGEASRLLPELRALYPGLPRPLTGEPREAQARLFEALCQVILGLVASPSPPHPREEVRSPLLLCLDDLNWADCATLDWLIYLGERLRRQPVLVIGTYRSDEAAPLVTLRHALARLGVLSELELTGLDVASVHRLLRHLTDLTPRWADDREMALATRLQQATGGNPFFLLEIVRALLEAGRLSGRLGETEDLPLPDTVRDAIRARLQYLTPQARQILEAGAVLGPNFGPDAVRLTAGRPELETMDGLDELVGRQLLVEEPTAYRFRHELIQRAVESSLSPMRRQLLHRRAGRALERLAPDQVVAMAHHFDAGDEVKKALHYYSLAAQQAEALFAWREAEEHQSRMLVLLDRLDPDCTRPDCLARRGQVLIARADQRYFQSRLAERDADLAALAALAETSGNEGLRLRALIHRTRYLNLDAQYEKAIANAKEGLAIAERANDASARCHLLNQIGFAHYFLGQPQQALAALEAALALAPKADREIRRHITHTLGYVHFHLGDYARSLACQQASHAEHQAFGDHNGVAWAGLDIGAVHLEMGHLIEARRQLAEHLSLARRIGARSAEVYGLAWLGYWELCLGDYAAALEAFQQALAAQQALRSEHSRVAAEAGTGLACYHLGDLAEARRWLECAVGRARAVRHRRRLADALIGLGLAETADLQAAPARACLSEAVAVARECEYRKGLVAGLAALARAERESGDLAVALAHAREAARVAQESALPVCEMWGEVEAGLALLSQGDLPAALEHTERAVALLPRAHEGWIGTEQAHLAHAQVLRSLNRTNEAADQARLAEAVVSGKAQHIPDSSQRERYLRFAHSLIR